MDAKRLLMVLAAAMAGAVTIPLETPGIGWAIAGVVTLTFLRGWFGVVAAALLGVGVVRSAGWVFALCAVTAVILFAVWRRAILPRRTLAAAALVLLGLAILNPDRIVAETVIGRWEHDGHLDAPYVASLSPDALPALERLPEPKRSCIAAVILRSHLSRDYLWNEWNASRRDVGDIILEELPNCEYYLNIGYRMEGNWVDPSQITQTGRPGG